MLELQVLRRQQFRLSSCKCWFTSASNGAGWLKSQGVFYKDLIFLMTTLHASVDCIFNIPLFIIICGTLTDWLVLHLSAWSTLATELRNCPGSLSFKLWKSSLTLNQRPVELLLFPHTLLLDLRSGSRHFMYVQSIITSACEGPTEKLTARLSCWQPGFSSHSGQAFGDCFSPFNILQTVFLLWFAWPHNWPCRLIDFEWDMKEALRTAFFLAVTTLIVPIYINCTIHSLHAGCCGVVAMAHKFGMRGPRCRSWLLWYGAVSFWARYLHAHSLDPGMNGYLVGQWLFVCLNSFQCYGGSRGCMLPTELSWYWNEHRSHNC